MKSKWIPLYGFVLLGTLLGGIGIAKSADVWYVSCETKAEGTEINLTGQDVNEIKGWMPLKDVLETYKLNKDEVYKTFQIPDSIPVEAPLKDIAAQSNETFSPTLLRDWLKQKQAK